MSRSAHPGLISEVAQQAVGGRTKVPPMMMCKIGCAIVVSCGPVVMSGGSADCRPVFADISSDMRRSARPSEGFGLPGIGSADSAACVFGPVGRGCSALFAPSACCSAHFACCLLSASAVFPCSMLSVSVRCALPTDLSISPSHSGPATNVRIGEGRQRELAGI